MTNPISSIRDYLPEGKQVISSNQDKVLLTHITQTLSITSNLTNSEGQKLFQEPKWAQVSDNFAQSIGVEKARQYGSDIFLLYFDNTPMLAYINEVEVMALDPHTMEARFAMVNQILEDVYSSISKISNAKDVTSVEAAAEPVVEETVSDTVVPPEKPKRKPRATTKKETSTK